MLSRLRRLLGFKPSNRPYVRPDKNRAMLNLEVLEDRVTPTLSAISYSITSGAPGNDVSDHYVKILQGESVTVNFTGHDSIATGAVKGWYTLSNVSAPSIDVFSTPSSANVNKTLNAISGPITGTPTGLVAGQTYELTLHLKHGGAEFDDASTDQVDVVVATITVSLDVTAADAVYDESPYDGTVTVDYDPDSAESNGTTTFTYSGINGTVYAASTTPPTNAGDYRVTADFTPTNPSAYTAASGFDDFTIAKAPVADTYAESTQPYDGETYDGATNAGEFYVVDTLVPGDANHEDSTLHTTITITQVGSTVTVAWDDGTSAVYDGDPHGATASWASTGADGETDSLTVYYEGINGTVYASSTTAPTDAGEYRASASFAGDTNHTGSDSSADFTITPAPIEPVGGEATTQAALNIAKQGVLAFDIVMNPDDILDEQSVADLWAGATFSLSVDGTAYTVEAVATVIGNVVHVEFRMSDTLKAHLAALTSATSAKNAPTVELALSAISMDGNYSIDTTATTKLFNSTK